MKAIRLFVVAGVLIVAGMWSLFANFHGNVSVHFGLPLSNCAFEISGSTKGGWVVATFLLLLAGAIAFLWALISAIATQMQAPAGPRPPLESPPDA